MKAHPGAFLTEPLCAWENVRQASCGYSESGLAGIFLKNDLSGPVTSRGIDITQ